MQKTKRIVSLFITLCMLMAFVPSPIASAASTFSGGSGTEADPYIIANAADFKQLATDVNESGITYYGKYFKVSDAVEDPIELSTAKVDGFSPIGTSSNNFKGTFDGSHKTVKLNLDLSTDYVGLFGYCYSSSVIKNVTTTGTVKGGDDVGGIAGRSYGKIINCQNQAAVTGDRNVGGIVGGVANVINCLNTGTVTGEWYTGGIVGDQYNELTNCVNNGEVKATGGNLVGGIAGKFEPNARTNCYYNSTINKDIYDAGSKSDDTKCKTTKYAVSEFSDTVLGTLNLYARDNTAENTKLLYWVATDGVLSLTSDAPESFPYKITNNSDDYITVDGCAKVGATVTITVTAPSSCLTVTEVIVKGANNADVATTEISGGYTFTMPESDVTVSATAEIKLNQEGGVYQISSAEEMKIFSDAVNDGYDTKNKSFKLTSDVSLTPDGGFAPIGTMDYNFKGTFDGNGKTVNLNLDLSTTNYVGLFGYCYSSSVIKNVTTKGTVKGLNDVGGIAGCSLGKIINCQNQAAVTATNNVGGIVGYSSGKIINCQNQAAVTGEINVGGITGKDATVINCLNTGTVTGHGNTGGIGGWPYYLTNCVNNGEVKKYMDTSEEVGGITGRFGSYEPTNCYYNSTINTGICDAGYVSNGTACTTKNCARSEDEIVSDTVLDILNLYARDNTVDGIELLYWKAADGVISLTSTAPQFPYNITNNSEYLTVESTAKNGDSVEITVGKIPEYMQLVKITVNGEEVSKNAEGKYVFTMPNSNVTVDAEVNLKLTKLADGSYEISTADELKTFAKAVNGGVGKVSATLTADITASTANGFEPISNGYEGDFNGNGHTLTLNITEGAAYNGTTVTGLFGAVLKASIHDLILKGSVDGGDDTDSYTGALFGNSLDYVYVYNVYSEAAVSGRGYVGGIAGNGDRKFVELRNVVNNGTVTQKNTAEDKKAVGAIIGVGNGNYRNVYYNSEKNSGIYDSGYDNERNAVTSNNANVKAKTAAELFSDEVMDELNGYVYNSTRNLMFWDISAAEQTVKFAKECSVTLYELYRDDMSDACIDAPAYSRAGKTVAVTTKVNANYADIIKAITGIKVTDSKGKVIDVTKTADNTYEFVMPEKDVSIQIIFEYNIEKDPDGVYCIEDATDLFIFSRIAAEQPDANAKVTTETIDINEPGGLISVNIDGLIGQSTAYKGTFDGNGAQIRWYGALFGKTDGAVIKNINIDTRNSAPYFAGVVKNAKNTRIDNCNAKISFNAYSAAGIVLEATDSVITNCSVTAGQLSRAQYEFGGIVGVASGNTVVANCVVNDCMVQTMRYGGIVAEAHDKTEIYNCVNQDRYASYSNRDVGAIVCMADMSGLTLENNLYYGALNFYDVRFDDDWNTIREMTDENSAVDEDDVNALYIPAKLNEYIEENPDLIEGTALNKWSNVCVNNINLACFADEAHPEIYSIKQTGIIVDTLVGESKVYGAVAGAEVTVKVPSGAEVTVTDKDGKQLELSDEGVFTMPKGGVTVLVVMDSGIEETTEIDGKTYAVVKNADDFIKAVTSIAAGNNTLNVYIAEDITLAAADLANYPVYDGNTPAYNATFDGAGHTVTFNGLEAAEATAMLALIGKKGVVKNLTVDGTISGGSGAAAVAYINAGTIINCINKSAISGGIAAGIAGTNVGTIFNCINKGDISGSSSAAMAYWNNGEVALVANEGTISNPSESGNSFIASGNSANMCIDLSAETEKSAWEKGAAALNSALEQAKAYRSLLNNCREWSVAETDTSAEIVFADEANVPYYMLTTPDGHKPYKAGSTVEVTFNTSELDEGLVIGSATVQAEYVNEEFDAAPVEGKENTFSFTMPAKTCQIVMNVEPTIEKDENGYYLVSTLDDLIKVKQTIEYGNNGINIKLMNNIETYDGDPIGDDYGYSGIFDGNGYSVTLAMSDEDHWDEYGLFTTLNSDAVVKNLTIEGSIEADADYMGAVAGESYGEITDCVNNAAVTNNSDYAGGGGIVGSVEGLKTNPAKLTNCVNNGNVTGDDAGGIVFYIKDYVVITNCVNNGDVYAEYDDAGGIAAQGGNVEIINCINNGDVSGDYAGGIIGNVWGNSVINNCINNGDVDADTSTGGIVGCGEDDLTIKNCYNGGNVTGDNDVYAIAYYDTSYDGNMIILNSFYLQTESINAGLKLSNLENENDSSQAVTGADIISGYVAAKLNSGVMEGLHRWDVKNDKLVFAEEGSKLYYEVIINENITGGTVTSDKAFARAGETVTLTITPDKAGQSAIVAGVELDENNSFVMPNEPVGIFAVFGDVFKGTEKSDVIELMQNVEMEEVKLADYVKFENDALTRDFTFTLAEGSVLPDGLTLSDGKISGTPTQLGTYTVVFDVTDPGEESTVSLMALDPDKAVGSAQLKLTFKVAEESAFIAKGSDTADGKQTIKYHVPAGTDYVLIIAKYAENGSLSGVETINSDADTNNGKLVVNSAENVKIMLWSSLAEMRPLCQNYEVK